MILNINTSQNTILSHPSFYENFESNSTTSPSHPSTPFFSEFNIFSPIQSLLSLLNLTSFFQFQYTGSHQNETSTTTTTTHNPIASSSSYNTEDATSDVLDILGNYSLSKLPFNLSNWSSKTPVDHFIKTTNPFERIYYGGPFNHPNNIDTEIEVKTLDNTKLTTKDYGMITERLDDTRDTIDYGGGKGDDNYLDLNLTFIDPILNVTGALDLVNVTDGPWTFGSVNGSFNETVVNDAVVTIITAVVLAFLILLTVVGE